MPFKKYGGKNTADISKETITHVIKKSNLNLPNF